jgi:hypothetical protein
MNLKLLGPVFSSSEISFPHPLTHWQSASVSVPKPLMNVDEAEFHNTNLITSSIDDNNFRIFNA